MVRLTLRFLQHGHSKQSIRTSVTHFISGHTHPQFFSNIYLNSLLVWQKLIGNSSLMTTNTKDEFLYMVMSLASVLDQPVPSFTLESMVLKSQFSLSATLKTSFSSTHLKVLRHVYPQQFQSACFNLSISLTKIHQSFLFS